MAYITGVSIFCPAGNRTLLADTALSLYNLGMKLTEAGIRHGLTWTSCSDITELRNFALTRWYDTEPGASHLLMVDSDMGWDPQMVLDMLAFDKPLTGCIYIKRQLDPIVPLGSVKTGKETTDDVDHGFLEVESVAAGVLMIKREVIDKMIMRYPEMVDSTGFHQVVEPLRAIGVNRLIRAFDPISFPVGHPYAPNGGKMSEDLSFCYRWRECGGKVWANVAYAVHHVGMHSFTARYIDLLTENKRRKDAGEEMLGGNVVACPEHPLPPIIGEPPRIALVEEKAA